MKLTINNFAKIKNAEIESLGITVVAGENNTGKSTVGKILFSIFNLLVDVGEKVQDERYRQVRSICNMIIRDNILSQETESGIYTRKWFDRTSLITTLAKRILKENNTDKDVIKNILTEFAIIKESSENNNDKLLEKISTEIAEKTSKSLSYSDETLIKNLVTRFFDNIFHSQVNSMIASGSEKPANLELEIKDFSLQLQFTNNVCDKYESDFEIAHKAVYIDNPFVLDSIYDDVHGQIVTERFFKVLLNDKDDIHLENGVIENITAKEKIAEVENILNSVANGKIIETNSGLYFQQENFNSPLYVNNLSTGLKSFVILKLLLERGKIKEKDVLILDEPEIHLHPEWQILYAQIIVLLQKKFDLSVIITTHSPYFLDAINLYAIKYGQKDKSRFYISEIENNYVTFKDVSNNIDEIYKKMSNPIQILDTLRYELNNAE